jgi:L-alanine-DL-glutamate epimerase-like enolase superfamily enzyme
MDVSIQHIEVKLISIPFKVAFRHASATRDTTAGIWVEINSEQGLTGYGEGCPRDYVTGETLDTAVQFIRSHREAWRTHITNLATLQDWMAQHRTDIDANPAAWCAVELALLDLMARANQQSVETLLGLPNLSGVFHYSAILGDSERDAFDNQYQRYRQMGFTRFKLKLSGDLQRDQEKLAVFRKEQNAQLQVRADANNLWQLSEQAIQHIQALDYPFAAI